ncbi:MAG: DUF4864 domain-containing protein [Verrucomicrobia bacterium]|nr:DUF4864 domain-containing protein [Verrucomicrobiota bacterium]
MNPRGKITLVLFFFSVCATAALVHYWDGVRSERLQPAELFNVVGQQLAACRNDDFSAAYQQASATVHQRFPLERFADMLRNENARWVKTGRVEFGPWRRRGNQAVVEVLFIGRDGSVSPCIYSLVCEGRDWKIDGTRWVNAWKSGQQLRGIRS